MRASILAGTMAAAAVAIAVVLLFVTMAHGHEMMGTHDGQFLWGRFIGDPPDGGRRNCCREGGSGDCQEYTGKVRIVPGGYELDGGIFIAHRDTNISPQDADGGYRFWLCAHPGALPHCWFAPPNGS